MYKGGWELGEAHGVGKSFQVFGNYEGEHSKGLREGIGKFTFANGDMYEGEVGCTPQHTVSLVRGHEYSFGLPHGRGTMTFTDGSKVRLWPCLG